MNPAAERVVERDIVFGDQSAAGGGGTESAKTDSLRGGIGDERAGTAKELDAGQRAQLIVEGDGGGGAQGFAGEQARSDGALQDAERGAIGGDGDLLGFGDWSGFGGRCRVCGIPGPQVRGTGSTRRCWGCGRELLRGLGGKGRRDEPCRNRQCNDQHVRATDRFVFEPPHGMHLGERGKKLFNHCATAGQLVRRRRREWYIPLQPSGEIRILDVDSALQAMRDAQ